MNDLTEPTTILVTQHIVLLREQKVIIDADLAALYGVETKRFNEQVKRNLKRFPADFMFQLTEEEFQRLRSQNATSNGQTTKRGGRRYLPYAFTEHGTIMAAMILNSQRAIEVSTYVVRAFIKLREVLASHHDLSTKLQSLEEQMEVLSYQQDAFAQNTRAQLKRVFDTLKQLMNEPEYQKRPIGFVTKDKE
jgi:phage regulator Rha-like protein